LHCESPTSVGDPETQSARSTRLEVWPNPARTEAHVAFVAPAAGAVRLEVFDVAGRRVREAFAGTVGAGRHVVRWDGRDAAGAPVGSGVYLVRFSGPQGAAATRRMALMR
jgi:flagellar hook assembly protein FlgD